MLERVNNFFRFIICTTLNSKKPIDQDQPGHSYILILAYAVYINMKHKLPDKFVRLLGFASLDISYCQAFPAVCLSVCL